MNSRAHAYFVFLLLTFPFLAALSSGLNLRGCAIAPPAQRVPVGHEEVALLTIWKAIDPSSAAGVSSQERRYWQMKTTTWLPSEWPPTATTSWTRYGYGLDVTMDGSAGVSAPFARIERKVGAADCGVIRMTPGIRAVTTHAARPHGGWNYTLDDERKVLAQALELTSAPPAGASETKLLAAYYRSWKLGSAEIATVVTAHHRAFFAWLDKQP